MKTLKRDGVEITSMVYAQTVLGVIGGWLKDDNEITFTQG